MLINPPEEWKKENINGEADRTSTEQVPNKLAEQVSDAERILIMSIGEQELSMKQIMEATGKMHRPSLLYNYIEPAIKDGIVTLLYPNSPRHPRQKYKLTVKGLALLHDLKINAPYGSTCHAQTARCPADAPCQARRGCPTAANRRQKP
jgi:DNA-binding HxlR family transcriptional regulator